MANAMSTGYVIGGAGFLGSRLVHALVASGQRVGVIDPLAVDVAGACVVRGLVDDAALARLRDDVGAPSCVYHLGGSGSVGIAEADADEDRRRTIDSTQLLLAALDPGVKLVLVSSAAVYGEGAAGRISEQHACHPISTYGRHKLEAEQLVGRSGRAHAIVRLFSVYGPALRKQLLWDACHKLRRGVTSFAGTGEELRDWVHVDDAVSLLQSVARATDNVLINGGTGVGTSVESVLKSLQDALGVNKRLAFSGEVRSGDPRSLVADATRAHALGWRARVDVATGIADYARWFEAQAC